VTRSFAFSSTCARISWRTRPMAASVRSRIMLSTSRPT